MLLVYDGGCGFCLRSARWIGARLAAEARVEPWQSLDLGAVGLSLEQVQAAVWWVPEPGASGPRFSGADAIARALATAGGTWGVVGRVMARPPVCWLARLVYKIVAANRHRLPGTG